MKHYLLMLLLLCGVASVDTVVAADESIYTIYTKTGQEPPEEVLSGDAAATADTLKLLKGEVSPEANIYAYDFGIVGIKPRVKTLTTESGEKQQSLVIESLTVGLTEGLPPQERSVTLSDAVLEIYLVGTEEPIASVMAPTFVDGKYVHTSWTKDIVIGNAPLSFTVKLNSRTGVDADVPLPPLAGDTIEPSDYSNSANWYCIGGTQVAAPETATTTFALETSSDTTEVDTGVDIFFIYPTIWTRTPGNAYVCEIDDATMLARVPFIYKAQASAFKDVGKLYMPYYRQLDAAWAVEQGLANSEKYFEGIPYTDVEAAFEYYLEHYNNGRPFILAGHSQGSAMTKALVKNYMAEHPEVYKRMIAAYVIGYYVSEEDLATHPHMKFATGADDTGVICSWNTEAPEAQIVPDGINTLLVPGQHAISINPISWTRTETPAGKEENIGARPCNQAAQSVPEVSTPGLFDATVNLARGTVVCSTADVDTYAPGASLFPRGVFHTQDYGFYFDNITANAQLRAAQYFKEQALPTTPDGIATTDYSVKDEDGLPLHWHAAPADGKVIPGVDSTAPLKEVDVFALYPTSWTRASGGDYACDVTHTEMRSRGGSFINGKISAFKEVANIYAPYYRQLDAAWALGKDASIVTSEHYFNGIPYADVRAAFLYYLEHYNNGRPFILASHSQGSCVMKFLLKDVIAHRQDLKEKLIAAYVVGFTITDADLEAMGLPFAQGADDTGVVLSWNTESPALATGNFGTNPILPPAGSGLTPRIINPLNWTTDTTPAPASANKGAVITSPIVGFGTPTEEQLAVIDATINLTRGILITHADPEVFCVPGTEAMFPKGCFHLYEYDFYYTNIAENAALRIRQYFNK